MFTAQADKSAPKKIIAIDLLRAVAALGVYFYHNHLGFTLSKYSGLHNMTFIDAFGSGYAVPLFFLISGYCIHASNIKYVKNKQALPLKKYYKRRLLRIYPPYLAALLFAVATYYSTMPAYRVNSLDLLTHLFVLQGFSVPYFNTINVVLWTISIELAFYFIYPLFYLIRLKYSLSAALLFTLLVSVISIIYFQSQTSISLPQFFFVLNLWFSWCCGAFLADKKMLNPTDLRDPVYIIAYLFILTGFVALKLIPNHLDVVFHQLTILLWTAPLMLILSAENWLQAHQNNWIIKLMGAVGLSSYSLYLFHEPLIYLKNLAIQHFLPQHFQPAAVGIGILIIPVLTWFSYLTFEKPFITKKQTVI